MLPRIAFVGAGPTTIYTLCAYLNEVRHPSRVTIFEQQTRAGLGTPYRPGWNDPAMLSNIASIEIPPIEQTLVAWLSAQPRPRLVRLGIDPDAIDDHAFYPRIALGEYFLDQFGALIARGRRDGTVIEIATDTCVTDIAATGNRLCLSLDKAGRPTDQAEFDHVVLATGHQWPDEPEVRPGVFLSPWPATALQRIAATDVAIRGSSLTAIDAAVALAEAHGSLVEVTDERVEYRTAPGGETLHMTMMSRKGLLPEADFYHPVPYEPLAVCTPEAMQRLIDEGGADMLDRAFELFRTELRLADPDYADRVGLADTTLEGFIDRYFAERLGADPFAWAADNLAEARANFARRFTVPWRYAILRMHEVLALIVPYLDEDALHRFDRYLKPIFVDEYATVPHLSIERLLALHDAGQLDIVALGEHHRIGARSGTSGATVVIDGMPRHFSVFIDATGQHPQSADAFPFGTLIEQSVVRDAASAGSKGIAVDDLFHPVSDHPAAANLYCLSIPFILGRHPFIQGITSSHELGLVVGTDLARSIGGSFQVHPERAGTPAPAPSPVATRRSHER